MTAMRAGLAFGLLVPCFLLPLPARAAIAPGTVLDRTTAEQARDLLPQEILNHYRSGDYENPVIDFPDSRWDWDDEFKQAIKWNREHLVLGEQKEPVDKATGQRPAYLSGLPFADVREDDPEAGAKILWNLAYGYYAGGNSHNWVALSWVGRGGVDRTSVQDVYYLYYEGQPRRYSPASNPLNLIFQAISVSVSPTDLQGTAALSYRFKDSAKRDLGWAYVPAVRRVRAVSPANRSDGFLGSDMSQDDGFFFDGKPEDFTWRVIGHKDQLRIVDPDSVAGKVKLRALPDGGWRTTSVNNERAAGFLAKGWKGIPWAPAGEALARRRFWVVEGVPRDKYYLYGRIELWIDDVTWQGAWNRKFSWRNELMNTYQVLGYATIPFNDHERWWGSTMNFQAAENLRADRATVSGQSGPGSDPANDRRIPLEPGFFDMQTLSRFGK